MLNDMIGKTIKRISLAQHSLGGPGEMQCTSEGVMGTRTHVHCDSGFVIELDDGSRVSVRGPHDEGVVVAEIHAATTHFNGKGEWLAPKPQQQPKKLKKHYSGKRSKLFWKKINATESEDLYNLGCDLQNLEGRVLELLAVISGWLDGTSPPRDRY